MTCAVFLAHVSVGNRPVIFIKVSGGAKAGGRVQRPGDAAGF